MMFFFCKVVCVFVKDCVFGLNDVVIDYFVEYQDIFREDYFYVVDVVFIRGFFFNSISKGLIILLYKRGDMIIFGNWWKLEIGDLLCYLMWYIKYM